MELSVSSADLIKKSCKQLWYLRKNKKESPVTANMIKGDIDADSKCTTEFKEMSSCLKIGSITMWYCIDEIVDNKLMEYKSISYTPEAWYLKNSILQVALYRSLFLLNPNKVYRTAKFRMDQGHKPVSIEVQQAKSILMFGNAEIEVDISDPKTIVNFFARKAEASITWDTAVQFDDQFKHREYDVLKSLIKTTTLSSNLINC